MKPERIRALDVPFAEQGSSHQLFASTTTLVSGLRIAMTQFHRDAAMFRNMKPDPSPNALMSMDEETLKGLAEQFDRQAAEIELLLDHVLAGDGIVVLNVVTEELEEAA